METSSFGFNAIGIYLVFKSKTGSTRLPERPNESRSKALGSHPCGALSSLLQRYYFHQVINKYVRQVAVASNKSLAQAV
jgi:hypothetical protein